MSDKKNERIKELEKKLKKSKKENRKLKQTISELEEKLSEKWAEEQPSGEWVSPSAAESDPHDIDRLTTISWYARTHHIGYETIRKDVMAIKDELGDELIVKNGRYYLTVKGAALLDRYRAKKKRRRRSRKQ